MPHLKFFIFLDRIKEEEIKMTVILCIDDRGGMLFNKRRVSRDRAVIKDIEKEAEDGMLYISDFSELLFSESSISVLSVPEPLSAAGKGDYVFVENYTLGGKIDKIDKLIIYKWNRKYPFDFSLDINPPDFGFSLISTCDFKGNSHDKITKEIYIK